MRMSARRTILTALLAGGAVVGGAAPALADAEAMPATLGIAQGDDGGDDNGQAPVGGVETGQGGTAGDYELVLPLGLLGGAAAVGGAVLIRRRLADQND
ncbi:MAG: hypothetical protein ACRDTF_16280 [Pseudonocardiaceae bacterium]